MERSDGAEGLFMVMLPGFVVVTMFFCVYILQMRDGRLYVGHSNNPMRRHAEHERGKGCRTTGISGAGNILYAEEHPDRPSAARREQQI